jgi:hypothetical protein
MPDIASWNPPAELLQLGDPDRAYWSRRVSLRFVWTTIALVILSLAGEVAVVYIAAFTSLIPSTHQYLVYLLSAACLAFAGAVLVNAAWWSSRRPNFFYAFYPSGLAILTAGRRWAFLPWRHIYSFDTKYQEPLLTLEDRSQIVVAHDFDDTEDFFADLTRYIEAKNRIVEDMPITASLIKYDKATRRQLLCGAILVGITLAAGMMFFDWLDIVIVPDRFVSHEELAAVTKVDELQRLWMTVKCPSSIATPGRITTKRQHVTYVESRIVLIPIQDRFLVANVRNTFEGKGNLRGEFSSWKEAADANGDQKRGVLEMLARDYPQYQGRLLPLQFDATVTVETNAQLTALGLAIGLVVGLGLLCRGVWSARHSRPRLDLS